MKILLILPVRIMPSNTGGSVHMFSLSKAWAVSGHIVHVLVQKSERKQRNIERIGRLTIHRLPTTISPRIEVRPSSEFFINLVKIPMTLIFAFAYSLYIMRKHNFDLIFVRYRPPFSFISLMLSILTKKPMIIKFVGTAVYQYRNYPFIKKVFNFLVKWSYFSIVDNSYMANTFAEEIPKQKLKVIPPPVDIDLFKTQSFSEAIGFEKSFVILYVSSFRKVEGVIKFILASNIVIQKIPNTKFILIGDGELKSSAMKLAEQLGLKEEVLFLNSVNHKTIPLFLARADVLVALYHPSYRAIPIKILEYGAAKKPIITTENVASIFEQEITDFQATENFRVVNYDVKKIANAIITLYKNKELRETIAENMYKITAERFSLKTIAEKYIDLFQETIIQKEGKRTLKKKFLLPKPDQYSVC